jgi:hypothetical protein
MENVRLERAPFFPFSDPIIPLALLLEIACWIGQDRKNLRSGPIRCLLSGVEISLKRASGMIGSEKGKNGARSSLTFPIL